ncbi:MAG: hypothetical protein HQL24_00165 [Candidatus Omnitrophica bacterium]|nr:hypothetical protein [Candidatus Omnitrophota bacterium]
MMSLLLIGIVVAGSTSFYLYANNYLKSATNKRIAMEMASAKMEQIKNVAYANLANETATSVIINGAITGSQTVTVSDVDDDANGTNDYKKVEVAIAWNQPGVTGSQQVVLDTLIAP